jgi:hypothetical protein
MCGWKLIILAIAFIGFFSIGTAFAQEQNTPPNSVQMQIQNKTYDIAYSITAGDSLDRISINNYSEPLTLSLTVHSDGNLTLFIPRELADLLLITKSAGTTFNGIVSGVQDASSPIIQLSCEQAKITLPIKHDMTGKKILIQWPIELSEDYNSFSYPVILEDLPKHIEAAGENFTLRVSTDAKRCDVSFSQQEKTIHVDVISRKEVGEWSNGSLIVDTLIIDIPHALLDGNYTVYADGKIIPFSERIFNSASKTELEETLDSTGFKGSILQFHYPNNTTSIDIVGATVVPEFRLNVFPYVAGFSALAAILILRRSSNK